jgi:hypothetical protein
MGKLAEAPSAVGIYHRVVGDSHIFTSPDLPGMHVGHPDARAAFAMIAPAVGLLVGATYGVNAEYEPDIKCEDFMMSLNHDLSDEVDEESLLEPAFCARIALNHQTTLM